MAELCGSSALPNWPMFRTATVLKLMYDRCSRKSFGQSTKADHGPESTLPVAEFVENCYLPFVRENYKPSTSIGYDKIWKKYLAPRLRKTTLRDFRTVDAAGLLTDIHRHSGLGRTMLKHIKAFLSGVFTYAKNQGALDGVNPVRDAMIPKKAAAPEETYAATLSEVLAILDVLEKHQELRARAAVALMFFAGLRPGEARGVCWEDYDGKRLFVRRSRWRVWTTPPKTESSVKPVPVIEPLGGILAELREADGNPSSGPILRGPSGSPLDLDNLAERVVKPALLAALYASDPSQSMSRQTTIFS
jgi:integrase